jgi:rubrerythrin
VTRWYVAIEKFECRDCGAAMARSDLIHGRCPSCGWTDKKQVAFDKKLKERQS